MSDGLTVQELHDQSTPSGLKKFLTASVLAHVAQHHPSLAQQCAHYSPWVLPADPRALRRFYAPPETGTRNILLQVLKEVAEDVGVRIDFSDVSGYNSRRVGEDTAPGIAIGWVDDRHDFLLSFALKTPDTLVLRHYASLDAQAIAALASERSWSAPAPQARRSLGPR